MEHMYLQCVIMETYELMNNEHSSRDTLEHIKSHAKKRL